MPDSNAVKERIEQLIAEVPDVLRSDGYRQRAWLIAAQRAVGLVCPSPGDPYHADADEIVVRAALPFDRYLVDQMAALMTFLTQNCCQGMPQECLSIMETALGTCCAPQPKRKSARSKS